MPRLKDVDSCQEMANRVLLSSVVQCCRIICETAGTGFLLELREAVAAIKEKILNQMPPNLLADFSASFINECASFVKDEFDGRAVLEMIMDIEIAGLRLTGRTLRFLKSYDAPRLRRLKELDLSHARDKDAHGYEAPRIELSKFQLHDLTSLKYPTHCIDSDLEIIARLCPNLEVLDLRNSRGITDAGLRRLSSCPNLRIVKVDHCPQVTYLSLSFLLSRHKKLEEFSYGYGVEYEANAIWSVRAGCYGNFVSPEFDMLSGLDFTVQCPTLSSFVYENNRYVSPIVELEALVTKFPNLSSFTINCMQAENLSVIRHLDKLSELTVNFIDGLDVDNIRPTWLSLVEALTVIGSDITSFTLNVNKSSYLVQEGDLKFMLDLCPNLEHLQLTLGEYRDFHLDVPSFHKLKKFIVCTPSCYTWGPFVDNPIVEFGIMLELEILSLLDMRVNFELLESMMLDNVKFPKLRVVKTNSVELEQLAKIERIARDNNFDFCVENDREIKQCRRITPNAFFQRLDKACKSFLDSRTELESL